MYAFFEGISERAYTDEQLKEYNAPKYEYNGKKLTEYEARQQQRYFERQIRKWKREYKGMESAGQPTDEAAAKISYWQKEQDKFAQQTGLKRQYERENVEGFGRDDAKSVDRLAKQTEIEYNKNQEEIRALIRSDALPKALNVGNQNKHIPGSKGYILGRSYIYGDLETAQELVNQYHGTGEIRFNNSGEWINKEFVKIADDIGVWVHQDTKKEMPTNRFAIHYGQKGTHIIPARRRTKK